MKLQEGQMLVGAKTRFGRKLKARDPWGHGEDFARIICDNLENARSGLSEKKWFDNYCDRIRLDSRFAEDVILGILNK